MRDVIDQPLRVVEIWGGPGAGKSTTRAALFARLKLMIAADALGGKLSVEEVTEEAKAVTWQLGHWTEGPVPSEVKRRALSQRQAVLFGAQFDRLARLRGQADLVISDSPLALSKVYADRALYPADAWGKVIDAHYAHLEVLHVWCRRVKPYETRGRNETEAQARHIDDLLRPVWSETRGTHCEVDGDEGAPDKILGTLRQLGWIA